MEFWFIYQTSDGLWLSLPVFRRVWLEWRHSMLIEELAASLTVCLED